MHARMQWPVEEYEEFQVDAGGQDVLAISSWKH